MVHIESSNGVINYKPILDTSKCVFRYPDRKWYMISYAKVSDNVQIYINAEGNQLHIYSGIVGVQEVKRYVHKMGHNYERNDLKYYRNTTSGCYLEIEWKYVSTPWLPISTLNKYNQLEVTKYVTYNEIS